MKVLILVLTFLLSLGVYGQAPSNDCGESPIIVSACSTAFSITQTQMSLATDGSGCSSGGSCPIVYVNALGYENFDCNTGTAYNGSTTGDDFSGSIENSMWWSFTADETCTYTVTIVATNCCCKDKGSSNAAQYTIFDTDGALPGGTIQNYLSSNGAFTGTQAPNISVTQGQPVYIVLDGVNGTDCDISVTIVPTANCSGCVLTLPIELISFDVLNVNNSNDITWVTASETNNDYFSIERSSDGYNFSPLGFEDGAGTSNETIKYVYSDWGYNNELNYYRLKQTDFDGESNYSKVILVDNRMKDKILVKTINLLGDDVNVEYKGLVVEFYSNGTTRKVFRE